MDPEMHFTGVVLYFGIRMCGGVVEELLEALANVSPTRGGHGGGDGADGDQHGVIYCAGVE